MRLLANMLTSFVQNGKMTLVDASGVERVFGSGRDGPDVTLHLHDKALHWKLLVNPELYAAEAYMDGTLTFENGSTVSDFLGLFSVNRRALFNTGWQRVLQGAFRKLRRFQQFNPVRRAVANAQHHYDLGDDLYRLFLDDGMNYSCAYFRDPETETLEQAQENKLRLIARKLKLEPGMRVAEIGSGWGSLAIHLAKNHDVRVTAINVATAQLATSRLRAEEAGVADRITFVESDYRLLEGTFDRVVSVGMMEHVGVPQFETYFGKVRDLLTPDGFALIHAIGTRGQPGSTSPFLRKYIFPGGYSPAMSEVFEAVQSTGLWAADVEILRLHYGWTIGHWRRRFETNRAKVAELYDERFCRMWEFYLNAVELGFLHGSNMVFQILVARTRDAVPVQRDYMLMADEPAAKPDRRKKQAKQSA